MTVTFTNARIVVDSAPRVASLTVEDGHITAIDGPVRGREIDISGDLLLPGFIDLHGDAIEKEVEPRPNAFFPTHVALAAIDRRMASAGVTTAYHGLSFAEGELGVRDVDFAERLACDLHDFRGAVDHRVHVRYEVTDAGSEARVMRLLEDGTASLLSFMDHTPGQGQFKDAAAYGTYLSRVYAQDDGAITTKIAHKQAQADYVADRMKRVAERARANGLALAGHDDEGSVRVAFMARLGAAISEFPLDLDTATAAQAAGMVTLFGAPNVLRGRSQSGALSARDAIAASVAGALCSDYAPQAMLPALGVLVTDLGHEWTAALALLTANPARVAGLADRGCIAPGLRADLIRVRGTGSSMTVVQTWVAGRCVMAFGSGA